jgi:tRNA(Leu) C34 or U34 (ribose-2'-O)-methylase TrmL
VKASAGAVEHLLLAPVDDLPGTLSDLHTRGVRIAGSDGEASLTVRQTDLRGPLAIVVGSEGQGLGPAIRRRCDVFMRIPMRGAVGSLNAAVAGSILLFEAVAQREGPDEAADGPTGVPATLETSEAPPVVDLGPGPETTSAAAPAKLPRRRRAAAKPPNADTPPPDPGDADLLPADVRPTTDVDPPTDQAG